MAMSFSATVHHTPDLIVFFSAASMRAPLSPNVKAGKGWWVNAVVSEAEEGKLQEAWLTWRDTGSLESLKAKSRQSWRKETLKDSRAEVIGPILSSACLPLNTHLDCGGWSDGRNCDTLNVCYRRIRAASQTELDTSYSTPQLIP